MRTETLVKPEKHRTAFGVPFAVGADPRRNPGGRPGTPSGLMEALQAALPERIARLEELSHHKDPRVALAATVYLIDRTLGKPTERVEDARPPRTTVWIGPYGTGPQVAVVADGQGEPDAH